MLACADIGGSFITFGLVDALNVVHAVRRVPTPGTSWPDFVGALRGLLGDGDGPFSVAVAGPVDPDSGLLVSANIPCTNGRALAADLSAALGRDVLVANDADCFALAEATVGAGQGARVVFGAILGTGVGGGLVAEGRLVRGAGGVTGEWGHGPMAAEGRFVDCPEAARISCGCGRTGCLDTIGGARGIERLHGLLGGPAADSRTIVSRWMHGEVHAARTMRLYLGAVSDQLAMVVNVTGADIVPVGGGLASSASLVAALDGELRMRVMRNTDRPVLVAGRLGTHAGLLGAAVLARQAGAV